MWVQEAWRDTVAFQRRYGLWISILLAFLAAAVQASFGVELRVGLALLSLLIALGVVLFFAFCVAIFRVPPRVAYEARADPSLEMDYDTRFGRDDNVVKLAIPTRNSPRRYIRTLTRPVAILFANPSLDRVIREEDLPAVVRVSRRGRVIVDAIDDHGFFLREQNTAGYLVELDAYTSSNPLDTPIELHLDELPSDS